MSLKKINIALYGLGILFLFIGMLMKYLHIYGRDSAYIIGDVALVLSFSLSLYQQWNGWALSKLCLIGCIVLFFGSLLKDLHFHSGRYFILAGGIVAVVTYLIVIGLQLMAKEKTEEPKL